MDQLGCCSGGALVFPASTYPCYAALRVCGSIKTASRDASSWKSPSQNAATSSSTLTRNACTLRAKPPTAASMTRAVPNSLSLRLTASVTLSVAIRLAGSHRPGEGQRDPDARHGAFCKLPCRAVPEKDGGRWPALRSRKTGGISTFHRSGSGFSF